MWTLLLIIGAIALLAGQSALATDAREIAIWYSHAYFIVAPDIRETVWETGESIAWSRWSFVLEGPDALFPVDLRVESIGVELDPTIWHKPTLRVVGPATYACVQNTSGTDITFSTASRPTVDPGVRITRVVSPDLIPPGVSDVHVQVVVTLVRRPTIDGVDSPVRAAWMNVFWNLSPGTVIVRDVRLDPGPWQHRDWPNRWNAFGFWLSTDALPPGTFFTMSAVLTVENLSGTAVLFRPTVEIQWLRDTFPFSAISGRASEAQAVGWAIDGPGDEYLRVAFSTHRGEICNWRFDSTRQSSTIWIYWPGAVGRP